MKITKILISMLLLVAVFMISGCNNTDVTGNQGLLPE